MDEVDDDSSHPRWGESSRLTDTEPTADPYASLYRGFAGARSGPTPPDYVSSLSRPEGAEGYGWLFREPAEPAPSAGVGPRGRPSTRRPGRTRAVVGVLLVALALTIVAVLVLEHRLYRGLDTGPAGPTPAAVGSPR